MTNQKPSMLVGWLVSVGSGYFVSCELHGPFPVAGDDSKPVPVYEENILPYRQDCILCGREIGSGKADWPVLFDGQGLGQGVC